MERSSQPSHYTQEMLEHVPIGIARLNASDLRIITANHCFRELFATSLGTDQHGEKMPLSDLLSAPPFASVRKLLQQVLETGQPYQKPEFPVLHPRRGITYWNGSITPIFAEGQLCELLVTLSDVTPQVLAHQQAEAEQKSLRTVNAEIDTERQRLVIIEAMVRNIHKEQDSGNIAKIALETLTETFDPIYACIHIARPERQELQLAHLYVNQELASPDILASTSSLAYILYDSSHWMAKARNYQEPLVIENPQCLIGTSENDLPPFDTSFAGSHVCIPLWSKNNFEGTLLLLFREVVHPQSLTVQTLADCCKYIGTALARARLHNEVRHQHTRLRAVLEHLPEGIFLVEAKDMRISYANEAASRILHVPREKLLNVSLWEAHTKHRHLYALTSHQHVEQQMEQPRLPTLRALADETIMGEEVVFIRPGDTPITLLCSAAPIKNEFDRITGAVSIFQDITARKSLEEQKNEFLSIASHELRTPIAAVQGFAEIVQMMTEQGMDLNSPHTHQAIEGIIEQSSRMTRLIDEMLDLSRVQHALLTLDKAPHDLIATLKRARESMAFTHKPRAIRLKLVDIEENASLIAEYDEERILQVLNNLLSNALKYSSAESEVEIGLLYQADQPEKVLFWVRDWGIGIPEADIPHIFKRFHRASNFDRSISGLGIGLYLTHEIVLQHGGTIRVESKDRNGSTFFIELPLHTN